VGVISCIGFELNCCHRVNCFLDNLEKGTMVMYTFHDQQLCEYKLLANLCKLQYGELSWISQVERTDMITLHESHQSSNLKGYEEK
jgi:hypothetical protein